MGTELRDHHLILERCDHPQKNPIGGLRHSPAQPPAATNQMPTSMALLVVGISYGWTHSARGLL